MTDATQIPEPTDAPAAPTKDDLAGLFKTVRQAEAAPDADAQPTQPETEPAIEAEPEQPGEEETQDFEAEQEPDPDAEPIAPTAPIIPSPPGMTQAQVEAFGALTPEMQQFVAGQDAHRTADYQRKTTELANQRRETDALRSQYLERLQSQIGTLEQQAAQKPVPPDPALRNEDPDAYEAQRDAYMLSIHQAQERREELAELKTQRDTERARAKQEFFAEQSALLPGLIPESTDPAKFATIQKDVADYALGKGYTPAQLSGLRAVDVTMLYQSMLWERAKRSADGTGTTPKPKAPKAQRPGTAKPVQTGTTARFKAAQKAHETAPSRKTLAGLFSAARGSGQSPQRR